MKQVLIEMVLHDKRLQNLPSICMQVDSKDNPFNNLYVLV